MTVAGQALGYILTILSGIALSLQSGINSTLGKYGGPAFASIVSFSMGLSVCAIYFAITVAGMHHSPPGSGLKDAPWWAWIGGALGALYVIDAIIFAPLLGAATLTGVFVCSQLITSVVLDLTGAVNFPRREFSWRRILGLALMVVGVILVTVYPGDIISNGQQQQQQQQTQAQGAQRRLKHSVQGAQNDMELVVHAPPAADQ